MTQSSTVQSTTQILPSTSAIFSQHTLNFDENEIRILNLRPGLSADPIQCFLQTVKLDELPHYEALSYVWGDPTICRPIFLDGCICQVTVNLESALRRLRYVNENRQLWVDALCINQKDEAEKSHQVNLMKDIYSRADEGLLWLGDYENGSPPSCFSTKDAWELPLSASSSHTSITSLDGELRNEDCFILYRAQTSQTITKAEVARAFSLIQSLASDAHFAVPAASNISLSEACSALSTLLDLPWWGRIWTVQEAVLPDKVTVICGSMQLPFSAFSAAARNFLGHHTNGCCVANSDQGVVLARFWTEIDNIDCFRRRPAPTHSIVVALTLFRHRAASDHRDKVFALLGLAGFSTGRLPILADYSLDWRQAYRQALLALVTTTGGLLPLIRAREYNRDPFLPSWVPDWRATTNPKHLDQESSWLFIYNLYNSSMGAQLTFDTCSGLELKLKGKEFDKVQTIGKTTETIFSGAFLQDAAEWRRLLENSVDTQGPYPSGGAYSQAFSRLLTLDLLDGDGSKFRRYGDSDEQENGAKQWTEGDVTAAISFIPGNQRFFITEKGLIGLGSVETNIGDTVSVLCGGRVPFILRPTQQGTRQGRYIFIGHAYVHGIMDGEAVHDKPEWDWIILV